MLEPINQLSLEILKKCTTCSQPYAKEDLRLIRSDEGESVVYAKCASCESGVVWLIALQPFGGMVWTGMKTDLTLEEMRKFEKTPAVSDDEVLRVHQLLRTRDAGIPTIFTSLKDAGKRNT